MRRIFDAAVAGADPTIDRVSITQEEIADFGFGSRQYVSGLLQTLSQMGLIERAYGKSRARSLERLKEFASGDGREI